MKTLLLAALVCAVPLVAPAQSDRPKEANLPGDSGEDAKAVAVDVEAASAFKTEIETLEKKLLDAAKSFLTRGGSAKDAGKGAGTAGDGKAANGGQAATAVTVEAAGLKLEDTFSRAIKLRVKPASGKTSFLTPPSEKMQVAVPGDADRIDALRLKVANAQLEAAGAAADVVSDKIGAAVTGRGADAAALAKRLMAAARSVSAAKGELARALSAADRAVPSAGAEARDAAAAGRGAGGDGKPAGGK